MSQFGVSAHFVALTVAPALIAYCSIMPVKTFQSWKEIAQYMGRGVRTVQRWEAFGLPVHRPAGRDRSAVFAIEHELDAWLMQTQTHLLNDGAINGHANSASYAELLQRVRDLELELEQLRERISDSAFPPGPTLLQKEKAA